MDKRTRKILRIGVLIVTLLIITTAGVFSLSANEEKLFKTALQAIEELDQTFVLGETDESIIVVDSIVDGDTIKFYYHGNLETARLIGIDTPETKHPTKGVECFGKEATSHLESLIEGEEIIIEFDSSQGERDRYNRFLVYVYRSRDNLFINRQMIADGYAHEYTYNIGYQHQTEFLQEEKQAQLQRKGLWKLCVGL